MRDGMALNLIYNFTHNAIGEFPDLGGHYRVLYFFTEAGPVPLDLLAEVHQRLLKLPIEREAAFSSLDDLKDFAMGVCQALRAPEVFLLSVQDYNVGVEATRELRSFRELYRRYGLNLANPDVISRGPGLFGKFFNPTRS